MPKICYVAKEFSEDKLRIIGHANRLLERYAAGGIDATLRQLYYRFVALDLFPDDRKWTWVSKDQKWVRDDNGTKNAEPNYTWLGDIISDARMAGLVDWDHITDITRYLRDLPHWDHPRDVLKGGINSYNTDKWAEQQNYVEVWVEKDALVSVLNRVCRELDVPYFSCRGYTSLSEMWVASQRLLEKIKAGKCVHIIHLGDHDPSGVDMSRDIKARLDLFCGQSIHIMRVALNWPQIQRFQPPPNPAKLTDSRAKKYIAKYGHESWELDALAPETLYDIIRRAVAMFRDEEKWQAAVGKQERGRNVLKAMEQRWSDVVKFLEGTVVK